MKIEVKYHNGVDPLEILPQGDCIDLRSAEDVFIKQGEYRMISLGVSMRLPEGCMAMVFPRSSTYKRYGILLTNGVGIIDNSYSGDDDIWKFPALCMEGKDFFCGEKGTIIRKNDRIAQFRIFRNMESVEIVEVDHLDDQNRGGLGSTGR